MMMMITWGGNGSVFRLLVRAIYSPDHGRTPLHMLISSSDKTEFTVHAFHKEQSAGKAYNNFNIGAIVWHDK